MGPRLTPKGRPPGLVGCGTRPAQLLGHERHARMGRQPRPGRFLGPPGAQPRMRGGKPALRRLRRSQRLPGRSCGSLAAPRRPPGQATDSRARNRVSERAILGPTGPSAASTIREGRQAWPGPSQGPPGRSVSDSEGVNRLAPPGRSLGVSSAVLAVPPSTRKGRGGGHRPVPAAAFRFHPQAHPAGSGGPGVARPPQEPSSSASSACLQKMARSHQRSAIPPPINHGW